MILKIHGDVDREDSERDTFVITEDHYIDYLAARGRPRADSGVLDGADCARATCSSSDTRCATGTCASSSVRSGRSRAFSTGGWSIQRRPSEIDRAILGAAADRDPRRRSRGLGRRDARAARMSDFGGAVPPPRRSGARLTRASCRTPRPTRSGSSGATSGREMHRRQPPRLPNHGSLRRRAASARASLLRRRRAPATRRRGSARTSPNSVRRAFCRSASRPGASTTRWRRSRTLSRGGREDRAGRSCPAARGRAGRRARGVA